MFGRKKKAAAATTEKNAAPEKQSQLAVLKDAYRLVRKESPAGIIYSILIFVVVLIAGIAFGKSIVHLLRRQHNKFRVITN